MMNGDKAFQKKEKKLMVRNNYSTELTDLLLKCICEEDPVLSMLEWLCGELTEAEVSSAQPLQ